MDNTYHLVLLVVCISTCLYIQGVANASVWGRGLESQVTSKAHNLLYNLNGGIKHSQKLYICHGSSVCVCVCVCALQLFLVFESVINFNFLL